MVPADLPTVAETKAERSRWATEEEEARRRGDDVHAAECRAFVERMDRQLIRVSVLPPGSDYPFEARLWRTGDAVWLAVSGEHYQALQTELRRRLPDAPIVVMTLINGWQPGYLPTASTYGRGIYQEIIAVVGAGSLETLIDAVAVKIAELFPA